MTLLHSKTHVQKNGSEMFLLSLNDAKNATIIRKSEHFVSSVDWGEHYEHS